MMLITEFNEFTERTCVSFDFDGVLHSDIIPGTIHPIDYGTKIDWTPNKRIHKILRREHKAGNKIIVVSARGLILYDYERRVVIQMKDIMQRFMDKYHLPIDEIILTDGREKRKILEDNKVIRHYDDNFEMEDELKNTNIEFVLIQDDVIVKRIKNTKK